MVQYSSIATIIKDVIDAGKAEGIKCNLTNLRRIIKWIPSKFNDYTKEEAISDIMWRMGFNDSLLWRYDCGSKAEGAWNGGRTYTLVCRPNGYYLICEYTKSNIRVYRLEVE